MHGALVPAADPKHNILRCDLSTLHALLASR